MADNYVDLGASSQIGGGGGGGGVASVTASSPLASSGGANPNITENGGLRTAATTVARNATPITQLLEGMEVYVIADGNTYRLRPGFSSPTVDGDWEIVVPSTGILTGVGNPQSVAVWSSATNLTANTLFLRENATGVVQNTFGFRVSDTPATATRYVDSVNGNDANSGLAPGVGTAWATLDHALQQQPLVAGGIYEINVAAGTYPGFFFKDILGNAANTTEGNNVVRIIGDIAVPSNVIIQGAINPVTITNARSVLVLDGVTLDGAGTSNGGVLCFNGVFDLLNVNIQNCIIGIQMNEASRGRWLSSVNGGTISASGSGFSLSRGASFSIQRPITITGFSSFAISASANALFGLTNGVTTLTLAGDPINGAAVAIQSNTGAIISSSVGTYNISDIRLGGNGLPFRSINGGSITLNTGTTINLTNCTRGGQIASNSYFQDGATGNTWNYLGGTLAEWIIDSNSLIFAPGDFSGATIRSGNQAGYVHGLWWNKQGTITGDFTLNSQSYSVKCNAVIPIAVTLPLSSDMGAGRTYVISDISGAAAANNITVTASGGDLINGAATYVINTNYGTLKVEAITNGWSVI